MMVDTTAIATTKSKRKTRRKEKKQRKKERKEAEEAAAEAERVRLEQEKRKKDEEARKRREEQQEKERRQREAEREAARQAAKEKEGENQTASRLLPSTGLTGGLNSDVDVVLGQHAEQFLVGSKVDISPTAVILNNLGGATVGRDDDATDLVVLNSFDEVAISKCPRSFCRTWLIEKSTSNKNHNHDN